jgi:hypothetical protein
MNSGDCIGGHRQIARASGQVRWLGSARRRLQWEKGRVAMPSESSADGQRQEVENRSPLCAEALTHRQHPLGEPRTPPTRRSEGGLSPDDGLADGPLGGVVRRLDALDAGERPERRAVLAEVLRDLASGWDGIVDVSPQQILETEPERREPSAEPSSFQFAFAEAVPLLEVSTESDSTVYRFRLSGPEYGVRLDRLQVSPVRPGGGDPHGPLAAGKGHPSGAPAWPAARAWTPLAPGST